MVSGPPPVTAGQVPGLSPSLLHFVWPPSAAQLWCGVSLRPGPSLCDSTQTTTAASMTGTASQMQHKGDMDTQSMDATFVAADNHVVCAGPAGKGYRPLCAANMSVSCDGCVPCKPHYINNHHTFSSPLVQEAAADGVVVAADVAAARVQPGLQCHWLYRC